MPRVAKPRLLWRPFYEHCARCLEKYCKHEARRLCFFIIIHQILDKCCYIQSVAKVYELKSKPSYVYCIMLRSANSQTNIHIDINSFTNFQIMPEYINNSPLKVMYLSIRENLHLTHRSPLLVNDFTGQCLFRVIGGVWNFVTTVQHPMHTRLALLEYCKNW